MKIFIIIMLFSSCSTLKKTLIYSGLSGAMIGGMSGALLSPNKESRGANATLFSLVGAGVVALSGYALYKDDPRNYKLKNMLLPEEKSGELDLGLGKIKIAANLEKSARYQVPIKELPESLKGKVKKQYLIKYESKERYINQGGKTFYIPPFEIYEHSYDEKTEIKYEN